MTLFRGVWAIAVTAIVVVSVCVHPAPAVPPTSEEDTHPCVLLVYSGIGPDLIAATGLGPAFIGDLVAECEISAGPARLFSTAIDSYERAQLSFHEAAGAVNRRGSSEERQQRVDEARYELETAATEFEAARTTFLVLAHRVAETHLDADGLDRFDSVAVNAHREVPAAYKVLTMTEAEWAAVEAACAVSASAPGDDLLSPAQRALLDSIEDEPAVISARALIAAQRRPIAVAIASSITSAE